AKTEEASRREHAAKEAHKALSRAKRDRNADIQKRLEGSDEQRALVEARKALRSATVVADDAKPNHAKAIGRLQKIEKSGTRLQERLESSRRTLTDLTRRT